MTTSLKTIEDRMEGSLKYVQSLENSNLFEAQPISMDVWSAKYKYGDESHPFDTFKRVSQAVFKDKPELYQLYAEAAMRAGLFMPAGRILAGAGTGRRVTLINCFVSPKIQDTMATHPGEPNSVGIMEALAVAARTQQMGGGIGMNFNLRPKGALVQQLGVPASGNLPFMDMWNSMCSTVMSSGHRRGAMMATMRVDHPDIIDFINAKKTPGRLTNFNVSVLVTDLFMDAVRKDYPWPLHYPAPPMEGGLPTTTVMVSHGKEIQSYVYSVVRARELWDLILRTTYEYAEPGVLFIDKINEHNNLYFCETITATNPCGEQPLPPNSDCNLGAINLAAVPFGKRKTNLNLIESMAMLGTLFLDSVLDQTLFPTEEQKQEALAKRRIGLGISGLANYFQARGIRYGDSSSLTRASKTMREIAVVSYKTSLALAKEFDPCPVLVDLKARALFAKGPMFNKLRDAGYDFVDDIAKYGLRNAVCLTIAPTGTTSIVFGNVASGCEPVFQHSYVRKVLNPDGVTHTKQVVMDYGYAKFRAEDELDRLLPDHFVTTDDLTVDDHIDMQAALQEWVDASISKTVNCPESMTFDEFKEVYQKAYDLGCKGCTTYRPSGVRGSVLEKVEDKPSEHVASPSVVTMPAINDEVIPLQRPQQLDGTTYKIKWPGIDWAFYVVINHKELDGGKIVPFEIFIVSKSVAHQEWIAALTRMVSAIFRRGGDVNFVVDELKQVHSLTGGTFINGKYVPSLVALIAETIKNHLIQIGYAHDEEGHGEALPVEQSAGVTSSGDGPRHEVCPSCQAPTLRRSEGCKTCTNCGYSNCG